MLGYDRFANSASWLDDVHQPDQDAKADPATIIVTIAQRTSA